MKKIRERK